MLAPNKQNLILLKNQKKLLKNGHKLLKEKRTGLIISFLEMANEGKALELAMRKSLKYVIQNYRQSLAFTSTAALSEAIEPRAVHNLDIQRKRISGVYMDRFFYEGADPERKGIKPTIRQPLSEFARIFKQLLTLSQLKINIQRVAYEIQKTSRQIVNLERKIEDTADQIKYITMMLNEKANFEKATLIKIFK
jgi:H(+)-transporting ATP synthase subunit D